MHYDFDDLAIFLAIGQTLNLQEAALIVHRTPAALSLRLKKLEEALGVELFTRSSRGLALTPAGADLRAHAENLLQRARRMEEAMKAHQGELPSVLRIASNSTGLRNHISPLIGAFLLEHRCRIQLVELSSEAAAASVVGGSADLAFGLEAAAMRHADELEVIPALLDRHVLAAPPDHPLAERDRVSFEDILTSPLVGIASSTVMGRAMAERARHTGLTYAPVVEMPSFALTLEMVLAGAGAAVVPRSAVERFGRAESFRVVPIDEPWAFRPLAFSLGRPDVPGEADRLARAFVDFALRAFKGCAAKPAAA